MFLLRKAKLLFAFFTVALTWAFLDRVFEMVWYFPALVTVRSWSWIWYVVWIGLLFLVILMTSHFLGAVAQW